MSIVESFDIPDSKRNQARPQWKLQLAVCLAVGLMILSSYCGVVVAATLDDISFSSLPGDRVQIKIRLSDPVDGDPLSFTIDNPARIAIDLPGTTLNLVNRTQTIGVGNTESVTAVQAEGRTRVVVKSRTTRSLRD